MPPGGRIADVRRDRALPHRPHRPRPQPASSGARGRLALVAAAALPRGMGGARARVPPRGHARGQRPARPQPRRRARLGTGAGRADRGSRRRVPRGRAGRRGAPAGDAPAPDTPPPCPVRLARPQWLCALAEGRGGGTRGPGRGSPARPRYRSRDLGEPPVAASPRAGCWAERHPSRAPMPADALARAAVGWHLADLAACRARVCLLTDTLCEVREDGAGVQERLDLLHGHALPRPMRNGSGRSRRLPKRATARVSCTTRGAMPISPLRVRARLDPAPPQGEEAA